MMAKRILLVVCLACALQASLAGNSTLCSESDGAPGSFSPIPVTAVPAGLAGRIADAFTGRAIGSYAPFLTCKAYEAKPSQACSQVVENGTNWKVDVYVTCTSGTWDNSVQSIIVHGEAFQPNAVDGVLPAASVAIADLGVEMQWLLAGDTNQATPENGDNVTASYSVFFPNGTMVETSSGTLDKPLTFKLGQGMVIRAWDEAVAQMRPGDKYLMVVRPQFAYGADGRGKVDPDTTLVFEITLISFDPATPEAPVF